MTKKNLQVYDIFTPMCATYSCRWGTAILFVEIHWAMSSPLYLYNCNDMNAIELGI